MASFIPLTDAQISAFNLTLAKLGDEPIVSNEIYVVSTDPLTPAEQDIYNRAYSASIAEGNTAPRANLAGNQAVHIGRLSTAAMQSGFTDEQSYSDALTLAAGGTFTFCDSPVPANSWGAGGGTICKPPPGADANWIAQYNQAVYEATHPNPALSSGGTALDTITSVITSAVVGALAIGTVGGVTPAVAAGNVATGQDVNANLGAAAGIDIAGATTVLGAVAGAAIAGGSPPVASSALPVAPPSAAVDITGAPLVPDTTVLTSPATVSGADLTSEAGLAPVDLAAPQTVPADMSGAVAPTDFPPSATTPDLGGVASVPSSPAISSLPSVIPTAAKAAAADLTTLAGATAAAKAVFGAVQSARNPQASQVLKTQSTIAAQQSTAGVPSASSTGGLALDASSAVKALWLPIAIVLGAKFLL